MDEGPPLEELDASGRLELSRPRIESLAAALGDCSRRVDDDGNLRIEGAVAESGRPFRIIARLEADPDDLEVLGEVLLQVVVKNRLGFIEVAYKEEEPREWMTEIQANLYACDFDPEIRRGMVELVGRVEGFAPAASRYLQKFEQYMLKLKSDSLEVDIAYLDFDDEDWAACVADLRPQLAALDDIARRIESLPLIDLATCAFCGSRFLTTGASRCTHCGAPV